MGNPRQSYADRLADRLARNAPILGDTKWVDSSEYEWTGLCWLATGSHAPGITNTPRAGEPEGSRDRKPVVPKTLIEEAIENGWPHADEYAANINAGKMTPPRLETDSAKRKDVPIYSGFVRYFPDAIAEVARLSKHGNDKHNPGQPLHWSRGKSDDHLDCLARHLAEAGTLDDDGFLHDVKIAWRALTNLQVLLEKERGLPISPGSKP